MFSSQGPNSYIREGDEQPLVKVRKRSMIRIPGGYVVLGTTVRFKQERVSSLLVNDQHCGWEGQNDREGYVCGYV
ncbi:hypothetical protein EYF80_011859 [Liparis tanakae]|uniref:Uncharacterized protein n=1 Tax=Liparis tanakae TaxID=230148 RepID=A0A4Z2IJ78_9TELE|nr:hypothetical protein EYF80_011859 [Liparis tanakae]